MNVVCPRVFAIRILTTRLNRVNTISGGGNFNRRRIGLSGAKNNIHLPRIRRSQFLGVGVSLLSAVVATTKERLVSFVRNVTHIFFHICVIRSLIPSLTRRRQRVCFAIFSNAVFLSESCLRDRRRVKCFRTHVPEGFGLRRSFERTSPQYRDTRCQRIYVAGHALEEGFCHLPVADRNVRSLSISDEAWPWPKYVYTVCP